jgi:septal ring factor EnvC (AmiA/AmiB activator)
MSGHTPSVLQKISWGIVLTFALTTFTFGETNKTKKIALKEVTQQIQSIKQTLQANQSQQIDLQQELKSIEIELSRLTNKVLILQRSLNKEQLQLTQLKSNQEKIQNKLTSQNQALAQQVRSAYRLGQPQQWKIILNLPDGNSANRYLIYYRYLNQQRLALIGEMNQTLFALTQSIRSTQSHELTMQKLLKNVQKQQHNQVSLRKSRQRVMSQLDSQTKGNQQKLDALIANQKNLQETIARLTMTDNLGNQEFFKMQNKLKWPLSGQVRNTPGSRFGITISAPTGTSVRAIYHGKVIFANWLRGFGLLVIINHGNKYMSLYGRNQTLNVREGDTVNTGEVIATSGNSGGYQKSNLYFEIRQNGQAINPNLWCRT